MKIVKKQQGFGIVTAIFLVTILSLLGGYLIYNANVQKSKSTLDLRAAKAVQAAMSGVQWGVWQVNRSGTVDTCPNGGNPQELTMTENLKDFRVRVDCKRSTQVGAGGATVITFDITATASTTDATKNDYVERQFKAKVERL